MRALKSCDEYPAADISDFAGLSEALVEVIRQKTIYPTNTHSMVGLEDSSSTFTPAQEEIRRILLDFSHIPEGQLKADTSIHQMGLDSINAIQLASRIRDLKGIRISAAEILQRPTIADIANMTQQGGNSHEHRSSFDFLSFEMRHKSRICKELDIRSDQIECIRPCTPLQEGLLTQFLQSQSLYVNHMAYLLDSSWSAPSLRKAWNTASSSHLLLRTGFVPLEDPNIPYGMVIYAKCNIANHFDVADDLTNVDEWRTKRTAGFHVDLEQPPWAVLAEETTKGLVMHLTLFHGIYDAHSLDLILGSFVSTKSQDTKTHSIDPLLNNILAPSHSEEKEPVSQDHEEYWKKTLENAAINRFPSLTPLWSTTGKTAVCSRICIAKLKDLEFKCAQQGLSLQAVGQAAWARLLSAYLGESNVTFGVVLSGRDTVAGAEQVAFPCITTVPVPAVDSGDNWDLLKQMMQYNSNIRKHQFTPLKNIQRWTGHANQALFDTIFAVQKRSQVQKPEKWKLIDDIGTVEVSFANLLAFKMK
jgi:acyl carrier protein